MFVGGQILVGLVTLWLLGKALLGVSTVVTYAVRRLWKAMTGLWRFLLLGGLIGLVIAGVAGRML